MKNFFKRLFCCHNYCKADYEECFDRLTHTRYSKRLYICSKCGKSYWIDGRVDGRLNHQQPNPHLMDERRIEIVYTNFEDLHKAYGFEDGNRTRSNLSYEEEKLFVNDCFET